MLDDVLIEGVGGQVSFWSEQIELGPWQEPQQITFATTMRAITLHDLLQIAIGLEGYLPAVTAAFVFHLLAPISDRFSDVQRQSSAA